MAQNSPLSKEDRRRLVEQQARDSRGRWIEEGKNAFSIVNGKRYPGTVLDIKNGYAYLLPPIKNPTHRPDPYRVPLKGITMSPGKGTFERAKDVRGAAEQEAKKAGNAGAYDGMTDQEFMDQLRKHRKDYEREMKKALSSDDTEDDKEYRKEHRRVVAQGKKNPDDVAPLPSRDHSDDSIQSTAKAMSEYTKDVQDAYKGDRKDFRDIGHQEFKDDKGNTYHLSPRQGKNGPEIVVRDEDKSEVFSFPANEGDSPEDLARKMLDVIDFEDDDSTTEAEQPTLFDMEEDDSAAEAEPKPSRAKRDSQKPEEEAQPTLFDEEDDSEETQEQEPADADADQDTTPETPESDENTPQPSDQPAPRSKAPAARRSEEALTISEDDLSGAINDARENDDREKLDRLTDLDQYGNAPAPYKSRGDRLIPTEDESRISGHNLRAWWARNTDEGAREEAINKLESRVSRAKDEFQQLIAGEEPPRLLDLNRAMSVLQRSVRDRNTLQQLNNPDWEPDDRELVSAQRAADQVREFRAEQRARNQETFNKHRGVRHDRLKDYRDKLADGSKERRDIDRYLNSIDEKLKENKGSYLGPALARELANAERHVKRQNQDSLWQEARTNHMPSEDLMDAVRIAMNNDVPAGMRLAYKYTGSMDDSDNLRYRDGRKVQVGDILYYQHQKKRIATEQDDTDGTMVVPFENRYTKVEVVTVPTKGSGDFRILPVEGEEIYSERINKDTGEIERYNVMTREDYLARGESSNSKPYIMANTDRVADLEYRHFNRVTVDNGIGGRIQSSSGARYRLADGSMVTAGTRVKYVNTIARTRDEKGNKVPVGTIMYGWIHSEVPNRNGTVSVARELADGSILQDAEGNRASEIDNDEGIKFTRQNIILRGQPSLANMLPADSEFDPPTKAQLNDGDNLLPLPEGMFRENGTGLVTAREGGEAGARELQAYQWGESHLIRDEDVVEDETPVRPDMPLSETNNRAAQLTRINTATPQRTATAVESEPAPTPEPTPEPEEEPTAPPAPALSPDDPRSRENAFLQRSSAEAAANYFNKRFSSNPKLRGLGVTPRTYRSDFFTNDPARLRHFLDWYMKNAEANSLPIPESVRELMRQLDEYDNRLSAQNKQEIRRGAQETILTTLEDKGFISISGDTVTVKDKAGALAELAKEADRIEKENRPKLNNSKSTRRDREEAHERNAAVESIRRQIERQSRDDDGPAPDILESDGPSDADLADEEVLDVDIEDED